MGSHPRETLASVLSLATIGVWCLLTGLSYLPPWGEIPSTLTLISALVPPSLWAWGWVVSGLACLLGTKFWRCRQIGLAMAVGMTSFLVVAYVHSWWSDMDYSRGWVTAKNYGAMVLLIGSLGVLLERYLPDAPLEAGDDSAIRTD